MACIASRCESQAAAIALARNAAATSESRFAAIQILAQQELGAGASLMPSRKIRPSRQHCVERQNACAITTRRRSFLP
jgi:hypothetical protein